MQDGIRGDVSTGKPVDGGQTAVYGDCPGGNRIKCLKKFCRSGIEALFKRNYAGKFSDVFQTLARKIRHFSDNMQISSPVLTSTQKYLKSFTFREKSQWEW